MKKLLIFAAFLFIFSASCKGSDLPTLPKWELEPVIFRHFTVRDLNVFIYPNQIEIDKQLARLHPVIFTGHNRNKGMLNTVVRGFYLVNTNSIHYIEGDEVTCEHEFEHAQDSVVWDNSLIEVNQVCF